MGIQRTVGRTINVLLFAGIALTSRDGPLTPEQKCLMALGESEKYCVGDDERMKRMAGWEYNSTCTMRTFNPQEVVKSMISQGGWVIIGDSLSREVCHLPTLKLLSCSNLKACLCVVLSIVTTLETSITLPVKTLSQLPPRQIKNRLLLFFVPFFHSFFTTGVHAERHFSVTSKSQIKTLPGRPSAHSASHLLSLRLSPLPRNSRDSSPSRCHL